MEKIPLFMSEERKNRSEVAEFNHHLDEKLTSRGFIL